MFSVITEVKAMKLWHVVYDTPLVGLYKVCIFFIYWLWACAYVCGEGRALASLWRSFGGQLAPSTLLRESLLLFQLLCYILRLAGSPALRQFLCLHLLSFCTGIKDAHYSIKLSAWIFGMEILLVGLCDFLSPPPISRIYTTVSSFFCGFWELNSRCQAYRANTLTWWDISPD